MSAEELDRPRAAELLTPIMPVLVMLAVMWGSEIIDVVADGRLDSWGIRPRRVDGLDGIVLAPFLHSGFGHLLANTFSFLVLGGVIASGSAKRFFQVTVIVGLVSGVGTWLTGPARSIHIGASGLVFGYLTYLISRGFFARKLSYIAGGILIFLIYGGTLWGLIPSPGVSWQGHLFGAVGGVLAAWALHGQTDSDEI